MRTRWLFLPLSLLTLLLASCGNSGNVTGNDGGSGPFDSNGNYVESWADSPSKWKKGRGGSNASPDQAEIVAIQSPLMNNGSSTPYSNTTPYANRSISPVKPVDQKPVARPSNTVAANTTKSKTVSRSRDEDDEDRPKSKSKATAQTTTKGKDKGKPTVAANTTKGKTTTNSKTTGKNTTASKTNSKTKDSAAVKVKPKAASSRYAVRQGDSLYAIAKRYGTTAGAIQKANGMSGTTIRPGQSLVIPK